MIPARSTPDRSRHLVALALLLSPLALAGCPKSAEPADCSDTATKQAVLDTAREWYLFDTLLPNPAPPTTEASQTPQDFLDLLTAEARAQGKDRYFSYLTTKAESAQFFQEGKSHGYGLGLKQEGTDRLFVTQVFTASPAWQAGFARGDELLAIAPTEAALDLPESQVSYLLPAGLLGQALSSAVPNTTRYFRLLHTGAAAPVVLSATTAEYSLDPVPKADAPVIFDRGAAGKIGYVMLRTFVGTADPLLQRTAAAFKAAGVRKVIVDLRYNGGGRLDVASTFLNLLRLTPTTDEVMYRYKFNAQQATQEGGAFFVAQEHSLSSTQVAFVVTGGSASASELLVNALQPYLPVALIGARTYGKPVGQFAFDDPGCATLLYLISFQLVNRDLTGDYFQGLPDAHFRGDSCAAEDDLTHPTDDPAEASTAAALQWLESGTCPAGPIPDAPPAVASRLLSGQGPAGFPRQEAPSLAQRHLPGLY